MSKRSGGKTTVRSIRLADEAWGWLAVVAERDGSTVNGVVAKLVDEAASPPVLARPQDIQSLQDAVTTAPRKGVFLPPSHAMADSKPLKMEYDFNHPKPGSRLKPMKGKA